MKESPPLPAAGRTHVLFRGRKLSFFAGCDYFRLSSHPAIVQAVGTGLKKYGLNVAASRVTTGNHALYLELEAALAKFFGSPAALLVSNGYASNSIVAQALRGEFSHVLLDSRAHVSLRDASRLFDCKVLEFKSRDPRDLRRVLAGAGRNVRPILLTDGVFTYEGEVAPLREYLKVLGRKGWILLDDAHAAGVIGPTGRGAAEYCGTSRERIIQTVTMSKAFGAYGGAVLCGRELRAKMIGKSAMFAGSTPLPLPLAYAALTAVNHLQKNRSHLQKLNQNVKYVRTALGLPMSSVAVMAITPANPGQAAALRRRLLMRGVYPSFIQYPGGPRGGYLRIVISSEHSRAQLDDLLAAIA